MDIDVRGGLLPVVVFFTMLSVGLDLELAQLRQVLRRPRPMVLGTMIHTFTLPVLALAYEQVLDKARLLDPEAVERLERESRRNSLRYHAYIASEAGELKHVARLLRESFNCSWRDFLLDTRSWLVGLALCSRAVLPKALHDRVARSAGIARERQFESRWRARDRRA